MQAVQNMQDAIILLDKPKGMSSNLVLQKTRRALGADKAGHSGTLDPMATGLLVLGVGSSTRLLTYLVGLPKVYFATIRLGLETVTDDREGEISMIAEPEQVKRLTEERIRQAISTFTGDILQAPSAVSAIKVDGRRAYDRVRAGEEVELKERPVTVAEFALLAIRRNSAADAETPFVDLEVRVNCSSGTYVRALARDVGRALRVGGHLTALRRESVGPFSVDDAVSLEQLHPDTSLNDPAVVARQILSDLTLTHEQTIDLQHGKKLLVDVADAKALAAIAPNGRLVGLVSVKAGKTKVLVNFPTENVND
jgi:tRNA pseudouridine55 synthase